MKIEQEKITFNRQFKTNSTYRFLDGQQSVASDQRCVARDLCPKEYVAGDRQAKQRSESDDVRTSAFRVFAPVALKEFTLVPTGPRGCYSFCTLVRTDVMMHNCAAEVSSTAVRRGFDRFLMTPWMACHNKSWYKYHEALVQAASRSREIFAAVPTCTSDAPVWEQAQKMQSLR